MLGLLLNQVREQARIASQEQDVIAQANALQAALEQQRQSLQAAAFQRQAEAASHTPLNPDIADLADHFDIEDSLARWLDKTMQRRKDTFEADLRILWDVLEESENPASVLVDKIEELASGTGIFVQRSQTHLEIVKFCKKYQLDHMATKNLIEALAVRERDHDMSTERDLDKLAVHLEHSSAPSKLISMKLKELRGGCNIGAVWHCCGDSRKRKDLKEPPLERAPKDSKGEKRLVERSRGPGIESVRDKLPARSIAYRSYSDSDLVQRFGDNQSKSNAPLMTEEEARNMQNKLRKQADKKAYKSRSRSPDRSWRRSRSRSGCRRELPSRVERSNRELERREQERRPDRRELDRRESDRRDAERRELDRRESDRRDHERRELERRDSDRRKTDTERRERRPERAR